MIDNIRSKFKELSETLGKEDLNLQRDKLKEITYDIERIVDSVENRNNIIKERLSCLKEVEKHVANIGDVLY